MLRSMNCPYDIDVTAAVMERVRTQPLLAPAGQRRRRIARIATAVAACAVFAVALNVTRLFTHDFNEAQIGSVIASVYNYHADYESLSQTNEIAALGYLYE